MQEFSVAFSRVTRAAMAADTELKSHVTELLSRAYFNLHAMSLTTADPQWVSTITGTAMQLRLDARASALSVRETVHLFENVIRISEEHLREARRHQAMASNVFYLKETSLDALLGENEAAPQFNAASPTLFAAKHSGRVDVVKPGEALL